MASVESQKTPIIPILKTYAYLNDTPARYKIAYGGRGSAKSWQYARALLYRALKHTFRIICAREIQKSIDESVYALLKNQITLLELQPYFKILQNEIIGLKYGSRFTFHGLLRNVSNIKSLEGADIVWVEEAHSVSKESWEVLIPTIRKEGSEIWATFNRERKDDPVWSLLCDEPKPNSIIKKFNWYDNPYFPETLRAEMEYDRSHDTDKYLHIWEGEPLAHSEAQVFKGKWVVESFETPKDAQFYHGIDWGFSVDPTAAIRFFIQDNKIYIDAESYGVGIEIDKLPEMFLRDIPTIQKWQSKADNARPETISYLKNRGFNIIGCEKWKGCVEDGIEFLKSFDKIVIHPKCIHTIDEMKYYSYKTDRLTGEITPDVMDKHNHCVDAIRYGAEGLMKSRVLKVSRIDASRLGL